MTRCFIYFSAWEFILIFLIFINNSHADSGIGLEAAPGQPTGGSILLGTVDGISVTVTGDFSQWPLDPMRSSSTKAGTLIVEVPDESSNWAVAISSDSPTGQLTEYQEPQYVSDPKKISSSLRAQAEGGNIVDLSTGGELISGQGDSTIALSFEQRTSWYDQPLPAGRVYRMVVTFTGSIEP